MSESTMFRAMDFGSAEAAMEAAMSQPTIVLALMFGFVLLLVLLLAERPRLQPAHEAHGLAPRVNGKSASGGDLPSLPGGVSEREKTGENSPVEPTAPIELPVPMNGAEALLMPLISQFSQMQQQMFEQFQQTALMMTQMFGNVQREQMALIRQELEQIQELTRQLHRLRSEGMRPSATPLPASGPAAAPSSPKPNLNWKPAALAARADAPSAKPGDADVHVWLSQRLSALHEERQSRWQKVLSMLTG